MTARCQCGHGFDSHYRMVPVWPPGQLGVSRCMECDCDERREVAEQASLIGGEES